MNIDKLEAGKELDAKIAQAVMQLEVVGECKAWDPEGSGYCILLSDSDRGELRPVYVRHCGCDLIREKDRERYADEKKLWGHYAMCLEVVPEYSTDIADAWEVFNKLLFPSIAKQFPNERGAWRAQCTVKNPAPYEGYMIIACEAETAELAICRLALKAIESQA